jgi:hypothetical protein
MVENRKRNLRYHRDADGIIAAYFASFAYPDSNLQIWDGEFGDITGLQKGDVLLDMRPRTDLDGLIVYDHHGPYPKDHKYILTTGPEPASFIVWNKYKDIIPKEEWWKLAIGLLGDGQPELIPYEVLEQCPMLLTKIKTSSYQDKYTFKWKTNYFILYKLLSSGINALLRIRAYETALNLVKKAKTPMDIIHDKDSKLAKGKVKSEFESINRTCEVYSFDNLKLCLYESSYRMAGYVATMMNLEDEVTTLAINKVDGSGSLRGDLALYWKGALKDLDYLEIDGHPGFMGARLKGKPERLIKDLSERLK